MSRRDKDNIECDSAQPRKPTLDLRSTLNLIAYRSALSIELFFLVSEALGSNEYEVVLGGQSKARGDWICCF